MYMCIAAPSTWLRLVVESVYLESAPREFVQTTYMYDRIKILNTWIGDRYMKVYPGGGNLGFKC
jgi:hypothetical protein